MKNYAIFKSYMYCIFFKLWKLVLKKLLSNWIVLFRNKIFLVPIYGVFPKVHGGWKINMMNAKTTIDEKTKVRSNTAKIAMNEMTMVRSNTEKITFDERKMIRSNTKKIARWKDSGKFNTWKDLHHQKDNGKITIDEMAMIR